MWYSESIVLWFWQCRSQRVRNNLNEGLHWIWEYVSLFNRVVKTVESHLIFCMSQFGMLYIIGNILPNTTCTHKFGHCFFSLSAVILRKHQFVICSYSHYDYFRFTVKCRQWVRPDFHNNIMLNNHNLAQHALHCMLLKQGLIASTGHYGDKYATVAERIVLRRLSYVGRRTGKCRIQ